MNLSYKGWQPLAVERALLTTTMPVREQEIDALARHFVERMKAGGAIVPKADIEALIACVVELMSANSSRKIRSTKKPIGWPKKRRASILACDETRLRSLIRQRIAQRKDFTL